MSLRVKIQALRVACRAPILPPDSPTPATLTSSLYWAFLPQGFARVVPLAEKLGPQRSTSPLLPLLQDFA